MHLLVPIISSSKCKPSSDFILIGQDDPMPGRPSVLQNLRPEIGRRSYWEQKNRNSILALYTNENLIVTFVLQF